MTRTIFIAAALALAVTLPAVQAQAQSIRTFVSTAGSDSNPCSLAQPCRHFSAAVAATAVGGEVDALDPGAYGSFTISHAITIEGQGWSYVASPSNGNAITINAGAGDNIKIHGVSLNGVGTTSSNGIVFNAGGSLTVTDCVAQNFNGTATTGNGILIQPTSGTISFTITNTIVSNNGFTGIYYVPPSGSATTNGVIDQVVATHNQIGIAISTANGSAATTVAISNSIASINSSAGIFIGGGAAALAVSIDNTAVSSNANGIEAHNKATVRLGRSVITGNSNLGIFNVTSPNTFFSYKDNRIDGNGTADIIGALNSLGSQ